MAVIDNLKAYWELNEASGNRADSHGSNTLTDVNTVTSTTGVKSNAASFDANNGESLDAGDNVDLRLGSDTSFTLAGWIRMTGTVFNRPIWAKAVPFGSAEAEHALLYDADNLRFRMSLQDAFVHNHSLSLSSATWYYVVMWHDAAADTVNMQVNNGTPSSSAHATGTTYYSSSIFTLGRRPGGGGSWHGDMDEVGFWQRALTSDERTWLYNSGAGRSYQDIVDEADPPPSVNVAFPRWRQVRR